MSLSDALLLDPQKLDVWVALRTDGVNGTGTIASVRFSALSEGTSTIDLSNVVLLDSNLNEIGATGTLATLHPIV